MKALRHTGWNISRAAGRGRVDARREPRPRRAGRQGAELRRPPGGPPRASWRSSASSRPLVEIFSEPALARALAFRGGTVLHKLVLPAPLRYSDDIDLVQVAAGPIGDLMRTLRGRLDPLLGASAFERSPISHTTVYRFRSEIPPTQPLRLKIGVTYDPDAAYERVMGMLIDRWPAT